MKQKFSEVSGSMQLNQIWPEHRSIIGALKICFRFQIFWFIAKGERLKGNYNRKPRPNFALFTQPLVTSRSAIADRPRCRWVIYGQKWKTGTGTQYLQTLFDVFSQQSNRIR